MRTFERYLGLPGAVALELAEDSLLPGTLPRLRRAFESARSVYHLAVHLGEIDWDGTSLTSLIDGAMRHDLDHMATSAGFRVSCDRSGEHEFQSPDAERLLGSRIVHRYRAPVNLAEFETHVKLDVRGPRALLGYQLNGKKGLDRRYPWQYHPRISLRTPIAFAMLLCGGFVESPAALIDPFCGSGTLLLEAASLLQAASPPEAYPVAAAEDVRIEGSDWDAAAVDGARRNISAAGMSIPVARADARELASRYKEASIAYVVTNPPFGIRLGRQTNFQSFYSGFFRSVSAVLRPGGRVTMLVGRRKAPFSRALEQTPSLVHRSSRLIEMGGVYPTLTVLERTSLYS